MYDRTIVRAAIMALTRQNVTSKPAPMSTTLMTGQVINANIRAGETVCCYYHDPSESSLLRIADVPQVSGDFSVDNDNLIYDLANGYIRIRNGLSGAVIEDQITEAYEFLSLSGGAACAYKISDTSEEWRFYWPDGHYTEDSFPGITRVIYAPPAMGYRNGLISVAGSISRQEITGYILTPDGGKNVMEAFVGERYNDYAPYNSFPVSEASMILDYQLSGLFASYMFYARLTDESATNLPSLLHENAVFLGTDQAYVYAKRSFPDEEDGLWWLTRWSIDEYDGLEVVAQYRGTEPIFYNPPTPMGSMIANVDGTRKLYEIGGMRQLYPADLTDLPATNRVRENAGYLWIYGGGVYQKLATGWLMYPTAVYPRSEPYGKLGYALRYAPIGTQGLAAVLFE